VSKHKSSPPLTAEQIDDLINSGTDAQNTPGANWGVWEALTNSDVTSLAVAQNEVQSIAGITPMQSSVNMEDFGAVSFQSMWQAFSSASATLDNGNGATLQTVASNIIEASQTFQQSLATQEAKQDWVGKTHDAALENINQSLPDVANISSGANALGLLINAFSHTVFQTQWYFDENHNAYNASLDQWPNETDEINGVYDSFAQDVMNTVYEPNISSIAGNIPAFSTPINDPAPPPAPPTGSGGGGGSGGGSNNTPPPPPPNTTPPPPPPPNTTPPPPPPNLTTTPPPGLNGTPPPGLNGTPPPGLNGTPPPGLNGTPPPLTNLNATPPPGFDASGLPNDSGITDPSGGSDDSTGGSGDFPLPNTAGITNPLSGSASALGGSGNPVAGPGSSTAPNGAGITDPFSSTGDPTAGSNDLGLPTGTGIGNPLGGSANPSSGSTGSGGSGLSSGLGQAAQGLEQPLQQALGAAQKSQSGMPGAGVPGGAPKDLDALGKPGTGGGHGGGGGGAGIGSQGRETLSPAGAPVAAATKETEFPGAASARPGTPVGAGGSPGGGSPGGGGGGQRGPGAKEHKANKALRRKKNGELVLGEVDAVVPVIGDDGPEEAEPVQRPAAPPAPQMPRPPVVSNPRRAGSEQRTEVGR
jgi:hypothetical protein